MQLVRYNHFALLISMPRINGINFYQNSSKIKLFLPKKKFFSSAVGSDPLTLSLRWLGVLPRDLNCLRWLGDPLPDPTTPPPIADFWLSASMKKNLLHVTAGLHLY